MPQIENRFETYRCDYCGREYMITAKYPNITHCPYCLRADEQTSEEIKVLKAAIKQAEDEA